MKNTKHMKRIACPYCNEEISSFAKKCRFCGEWLSKRNTNESLLKITILSVILICIFMLIFTKTYSINQDVSFKENNVEKTVNKPKPIPTNSPSKVPQPTQTTVLKTDPNKPVHCNVHENCGGGTTPLTQAECDNSICCWTREGYELMNKDECGVLENQYKMQANRTPVILGSTTYYCDESAIGALKDAQQLSDREYDDYVKYCITEKHEQLCQSTEASKKYYDGQLDTIKKQYCNL